MSVPTARELILGGQKSGKSRAAESRAQAWLEQPGREAVLLATALAGDAEMSERIERHRRDRRERLPRLETVETCDKMAAVLCSLCAPHRLVIVDCLTLWLAQIMFPPGASPVPDEAIEAAVNDLSLAARQADGPWVMVSNEIGFGVIPATPESRAFVDRLGLLHQALGRIAGRITLMVAGCECTVKGVRP